MRGPFGKDRYDLPNVSTTIKPGNEYCDAEYVRRHNFIAVSIAKASNIMKGLNRTVGLEQPASTMQRSYAKIYE